MIKRNTRLRREFIYRKSLEGQEKEKYEKKRKVRQVRDRSIVLVVDPSNASMYAVMMSIMCLLACLLVACRRSKKAG